MSGKYMATDLKVERSSWDEDVYISFYLDPNSLEETDEMLAKSWCENYCNRHKVELEVVKIEQFTEYKEVSNRNA